MFWKTAIFALLVVGVIAEEFKITDDHRNQLKSMLRAQCKKNNAEDKAEEVEQAAHNFVDCVKGLADFNVLKNEIEEAKPKGALDEVFKKYCDKTPQLKTCIHSMLDAVTPCLEETARDQMTSAKNGTDQLIDFVCHKDGDRIALFIAEGGPECFRDKANAIRECANNIKDSMPSKIEDAKNMSTVDKCKKFDELSKCTIEALEECETPTPGNMAESLFRYVRKGSPCHTALPPKN